MSSELLGQRAIVDLREVEAHQVVRDPLPRRAPPTQDPRLQPEEADQALRAEAPEVERKPRVGRVAEKPLGRDRRALRERDLAPVLVDLTPEDRAPGVVKGADRAVALAQPRVEGDATDAAVAPARELVVDLPGDDALVVTEAVGEGGNDDLGRLPHRRDVRAVVAPVAELLDAPVGADGQDLRVALDKPCRRRCRRRADDHLELSRSDDVDRLLEPIELELAGPRLEPRPGKLADTHEPKPGLGHQLCIDLPALARPLLRVVGDAEARCCSHQNVVSRSCARRVSADR